MKCNSCKDISFDKRPTYAELMETPHLDFWFEEFEGRKDEDPNWEDGDNLMSVIHCYECGTTYKADGTIIGGGATLKDLDEDPEKTVEEYTKIIEKELFKLNQNNDEK